MTSRPLPRSGLRDQLRVLRRLTHDPQPVLDELRDRFGPVCQIGAGPVRGAVVGSAEAVAELLSRPVDDICWGHRFNVLGFVVGGGSMIVSDGADHRRRRSAVQHAFGRRRLNGWIPMIVERTDAAIETLTDGRTDLYPLGGDIVFDATPHGRRPGRRRPGHPRRARPGRIAHRRRDPRSGRHPHRSRPPHDRRVAGLDAVACPARTGLVGRAPGRGRRRAGRADHADDRRRRPPTPRARRPGGAPGYRIPARTLVLWSAHLVGRDADVWSDPHRFDPGRWQVADERQRRAGDIGWVPFGHPPRNCIGFALARMELVLIVSRLAQRLDLALDADELPAPHGMVVNRPSGGVPVTVNARH